MATRFQEEDLASSISVDRRTRAAFGLRSTLEPCPPSDRGRFAPPVALSLFKQNRQQEGRSVKAPALLLAPIHGSAWKGNSVNFGMTAF